MAVNPAATGVAPFRQLANALRAEILSGHLAPGARIPAARDLVQQHDVALATAVRAVDLLRIEGLVTTRRGLGSFVAEVPNRVHRRSSRDRYGRARADQRRLTPGLTHMITENGRVEAPPDIGPLFGLDAGDPIWLRRRLLFDDVGPVEIGQSWLSPQDVEGTEIAHPEPTPRALFLTMEDLTGRIYSSAEDRWIARTPTEEEATTLRVRPTQPLLTVRHVARDGNGQVIEVSESMWPGDRVLMLDSYDISGRGVVPSDSSDV